MIGETNINGGSGFNGKGAIIEVEAETGSIITASNGNEVYQLNLNWVDPIHNSCSHWIFQPPTFGEWTINAVYDNKTQTKTFVIADIEQYKISFYRYYLYNKGDEFIERTNGWILYGESSSSGEKRDNGIFLKSKSNASLCQLRTNIPYVLFQPYKTLVFKCTVSTAHNNAPTLAINQGSSTAIAYMIGTTGENRLSIANYKGAQPYAYSYYADQTVLIESVWLE